MNQDETLKFNDGSDEGISMIGWTLLQVALALKANCTIKYLLES